MLSGVLPAVRRMKDFEKGLRTSSDWIIILESRLAQIRSLVDYCKRENKQVLVHFDLIKGLRSDEYGLEFIIHEVKPDGIISTRGNVIEIAKKHDLLTVQRVFLLDSLALEQNIRQIERFQPDYIEMLPGLMPSVIKKIKENTDIPIILGGLVTERHDIDLAFNSGAVAVSTSQTDLWED
jgi:glycerol uptake operon antiterminator